MTRANSRRRRAGPHLLGQLEQFFDVVDLGDLSVDHAHDVAAIDVDRVAAGGEPEGVSGVGGGRPPVEDDPAAESSCWNRIRCCVSVNPSRTAVISARMPSMAEAASPAGLWSIKSGANTSSAPATSPVS